MPHLHDILAERVNAWREGGYEVGEYATIAEILAYQSDLETGSPRFLRPPQLRALETHWYVRLVLGTPHILDLYRALFPGTAELLDALGLRDGRLRDLALEGGDALFERIRTDGELVREFGLESVRETLTLDYPSYILALAMGAGKTILIGAIIATEFAMAQEHLDGPFIRNALIFAPGKTIIEALRELADVPYDRILPPRLHRSFAASVALTFTRDGDPDIAVVDGSLYNVVVTNTEKIRIRSETVRKGDLGALFSGVAGDAEEEARRAVANRRLMKIASLPGLGIFSDEAHHTYGQKLLGQWRKDPETGERTFRESGIKQVRRTVDYLHENTDVVCVVNTTGTPYFKRQPLRDVVIWYGLSQGIRDGILKDVQDNIFAYEYANDAAPALVREIIADFFDRYGDVALPNDAPAKLALYFPKNDDLTELRPVVEQTLAGRGLSPTIVLRNTSESTKQEVDDFNRLNDPRSPHRVILLVNKGTEGWNCPSLFACALVRKLRTSNNFVLQAATRCLRQVPGNEHAARIYLSMANRAVLDRQLRETYGESLQDLERAPRERIRQRLTLRKHDMPPVVIRQTVRRVEREDGGAAAPLRLERPVVHAGSITRTAYDVSDAGANARVLRAVGGSVAIELDEPTLDLRSAAVELGATYGLRPFDVHRALVAAYGEDGDVPAAHVAPLREQIERQTRAYRVTEEEVERALALVRLDPHTGQPDARGWNHEHDGDDVVYTADISYLPGRERLLLRLDEVRGLSHDLGFHYTPYDFDSGPERDLFTRLLRDLDMRAEDVEGIYFTGALTDPAKTEFFVEYRDANGRWRRYSPDFVVRRRDGRTVIVEVKAERERAHPIDGERGSKALALRRWQDLEPDRLRYEMVFTSTDAVAMEDVERVLGAAKLSDAPASITPLDLPEETLRAFCEKWNIEKLEIFGSTARGEVRPDSDVDLVATFKDGDRHGLFDLAEMRVEIEELLGRSVDLLERWSIDNMENPIRKKSIMKDLRAIYRA